MQGAATGWQESTGFARICQGLTYEWATSRSCDNKPILRDWRLSSHLGLKGCRELSSSALKMGERCIFGEKKKSIAGIPPHGLYLRERGDQRVRVSLQSVEIWSTNGRQPGHVEELHCLRDSECLDCHILAGSRRKPRKLNTSQQRLRRLENHLQLCYDGKAQRR